VPAQDSLPGLEDAGVQPAPTARPADPFAAAVPEWLLERLDTINPRSRSASAKLLPCHRCRAPTLFAADLGLDLLTESTVDPAVLTPAAELEALLAGRYTVELEVSRFGGGIKMFRRDRWLITKQPGARRRYGVPQHRCGAPLGVPLPWSLLYPLESQLNLGVTREPPF
jgi:hypothetical protein